MHTLKTITFVALAMFIALVWQGCDKKEPFIRRNLASNPFQGIPGGADSLITIDVEQLRSKPLSSDIITRMNVTGENDPLKLQRFKSNNGVDLLNDVNKAVIALYDTENPEETSWVALLIGDFDKFASINTIKQTAVNVDERGYGDLTFYKLNRGTYEYSLAYFSPRELALSSEDGMINRMIELYKGAQNNILNDSLYTDHKNLLPEETPMFWIMDKFQESEKSKVQQAISNANEDPQKYAVGSIDSLLAMIDLDSNAALELVLKMNQPESAEQFQSNLQQRIDNFLNAIQMLEQQTGDSGLSEIREVFDFLKIGRQASTVRVTFTVPADSVSEWLDRAETMFGGSPPPVFNQSSGNLPLPVP